MNSSALAWAAAACIACAGRVVAQGRLASPLPIADELECVGPLSPSTLGTVIGSPLLAGLGTLTPGQFTMPLDLVIQGVGRQAYPGFTLRKRDLLVLIADDVGADKIAPYVHYYNNNLRVDDDVSGVATLPCTPTLKALSDSGVMFVNAWACPTCSPSRASLMTGTHPFRHQVYAPANSDEFNRAGYDPTTIAEVLRDAGYANGLFGKWHLGDAPSEGPVDNGWDLHQGYLEGEIDDYYDWEQVTSDASGDTFVDLEDVYSTSEFIENARDWINGQSGRWMATVAFNAAHTVGGLPGTLVDQAPPSGCACHAVTDATDEDQVFRATVECMDAKIAELLAGIEPRRLANTTIIFVGDNGTVDERSDHFPACHGKGTLYEGGVNVPFIVADGYAYVHGGSQAPASSGVGRIVDPSRISDALVQLIDLYPTIADIARADKSCAVDAVSLIPLLSDTASTVRDISFAQTSGVNWAVRGSRYKLVHRETSNPSCPAATVEELYDLSIDRWETLDLLTDGGTSTLEDDIVTQLTNRKDAILAVPDGCP